MNEYKLTKNDLLNIIDKATKEFCSRGVAYKQGYSHFLMECIMDSLIDYFKTRGIEIREGKFYVKKED
jgi:hypothetical protein